MHLSQSIMAYESMYNMSNGIYTVRALWSQAKQVHVFVPHSWSLCSTETRGDTHPQWMSWGFSLRLIRWFKWEVEWLCTLSLRCILKDRHAVLTLLAWLTPIHGHVIEITSRWEYYPNFLYQLFCSKLYFFPSWRSTRKNIETVGRCHIFFP